MDIASILSIAIAVTLLNVWLLRINQATPYRGGQAQNMKEEFEVYGLPHWLLPIVGVLKGEFGHRFSGFSMVAHPT